jgi:hypothetical protein
LEVLEGVFTLLKIAAKISLGVMVVVLFQGRPIFKDSYRPSGWYQAKSRLLKAY